MGRFISSLAIAPAALLFVAMSLCAQPKPVLGFGNNNAGWGWHGPKIVYPGFTSYYAFANPRYRIAVTCSATGNTCDASGSGYTPTGMETRVVVTATTIPTGMDTMAMDAYAYYDFCNVSGTVFQLCHTGTSTVETFSSTGSGVQILFAPSAKANVSSFFIASDRASDMGWPSGTTVTWGIIDSYYGVNFTAGFVSSNGYPYSYQGVYPQALKVDIPTNATPGDYTITITDCDAEPLAGVHACPGGSNTDTLTFTATVTAITYLSDANEPTSFSAITGLSTWVSEMTSGGMTGGGGSWCDSTTGITTPADLSSEIGSDSSVFYYDGVLNYWRIYQWTRDAGWAKCAQTVAQQSGWGTAADVAAPNLNYIGTNGRFPGYRIFPVGFGTAALQDSRYIGVVQYIALTNGNNGGASTLGSCYIDDFGIRETAYALDTVMTIDRMGLTPQNPPGTDPYRLWPVARQRCADELVGMLNSYTDGTGRYGENQYFMDGIAMDALIKWWQKTKDPRVPMVVKPLLDQYYSNYNLIGHIAMWDPDTWPGVHCQGVNTWYNSNANGHCGDNTNAINALHNLFTHAFAWYWRVSGDDTYRTEGDEVFAHAFDAHYNDKGKTFSQLFRYSFNYVGWRQGWLSPEQAIQ